MNYTNTAINMVSAMHVIDIRDSELANIRTYAPCEADIGKRVAVPVPGFHR